jgi:hypothetical protein
MAIMLGPRIDHLPETLVAVQQDSGGADADRGC